MELFTPATIGSGLPARAPITFNMKPRSLQLLDQAYDASSIKFSQILRYLRDHKSYCQQELHMDPLKGGKEYDPSSSPLLVDPRLAYSIHTGRNTRQFGTQGHAAAQGVRSNNIQLPCLPPHHHHNQHTTPDITTNSSAHTTSHPAKTSHYEAMLSRNAMRRQVWRLPSHMAHFASNDKYRQRQQLKLPPITVSKLMNGL